jgi:hypothetical protein
VFYFTDFLIQSRTTEHYSSYPFADGAWGVFGFLPNGEHKRTFGLKPNIGRG